MWVMCRNAKSVDSDSEEVLDRRLSEDQREYDYLMGKDDKSAKRCSNPGENIVSNVLIVVTGCDGKRATTTKFICREAIEKKMPMRLKVCRGCGKTSYCSDEVCLCILCTQSHAVSNCSLEFAQI